jgi:TPR repeat protein
MPAFLDQPSGALATGHAPAKGQASLPACLKLAGDRSYTSDEGERRRSAELWVETCREALRTDTANPAIKVSLGQALGAGGRRDEEITWLRAAAAQDHADAHYRIYEEHKSFGRHLDRPVRVGRAEGERSLRAAAELGHPEAMHVLAVLLDRGGPVKRDPAQARLWAERALAKPSKDREPADLQVLLGRLLVTSEKADEPSRGLAILEALARAGRGDAKAELAEAIRKDDPVRARALLEEALRSYPGHAIAPLADMLIKGEGGPKDEKRAVKLLHSDSTVPAIGAARGQLYLEGRLVPRDLPRAIKAIDTWPAGTTTRGSSSWVCSPPIPISRSIIPTACSTTQSRRPNSASPEPSRL